MPSKKQIETAAELHTKVGMMPRRLRRTLFEHFFFLFRCTLTTATLMRNHYKIPKRTSLLNFVLIEQATALNITEYRLAETNTQSNERVLAQNIYTQNREALPDWCRTDEV